MDFSSYQEFLSSMAPFLLYVFMGVIIFLETGVLVAFFIPGDSLLFFAGLVAASTDNVNILLLVSIIFLAAFMGDQVGFALGRTVGRSYLEKSKRPRFIKMVASAERFYSRYGWWAVVFARFYPWIRTFVPPIAGISKMNYYRFLSANALGAFVWGVGMTLLGYYAVQFPWIDENSKLIALFFIVLSLVSGFVNYLRLQRSPQSKS
jgi:membrane-associated protein